MTDYTADASILRDQMVDIISGNAEQVIYVVTGVMGLVIAADVIEGGEMNPDVDRDLVIANLRRLADDIENGDLS
jgi:DNA polymerase II small subunit/DNA polymerase delta subunit B